MKDLYVGWEQKCVSREGNLHFILQDPARNNHQLHLQNKMVNIFNQKHMLEEELLLPLQESYELSLFSQFYAYAHAD